MGSETHNYHREAMARRGYPDEAARIQELWRAGRRDEAVAAVPDEYHDDGALIGSEARIRARWEPWTRSGLTGLIVRAEEPAGLELMAELAGTRDQLDRCDDRGGGIVTYELIEIDHPAEYVARITLNRPEKRNAISTPMRAELFGGARRPRHRPRGAGHGAARFGGLLLGRLRPGGRPHGRAAVPHLAG